jgi:hypothetical protein
VCTTARFNSKKQGRREKPDIVLFYCEHRAPDADSAHVSATRVGAWQSDDGGYLGNRFLFDDARDIARTLTKRCMNFVIIAE